MAQAFSSVSWGLGGIMGSAGPDTISEHSCLEQLWLELLQGTFLTWALDQYSFGTLSLYQRHKVRTHSISFFQLTPHERNGVVPAFFCSLAFAYRYTHFLYPFVHLKNFSMSSKPFFFCVGHSDHKVSLLPWKLQANNCS